MKFKYLLCAFLLLTIKMSFLSAAQVALISNVGNSDVTLINTVTDTAIANVSTGAGPVGSAITPDGQKAYVANSDNTVTVVNLATLTTTTLSDPAFGFNTPQTIAITPDGSKAYVTNFSGNSVTVINTSNDTLNTLIPGVFFGIGIAITPDGSTALVATTNSVTKIDLATNSVSVITSPNFNQTTDIAVKPDGSTGYITDLGNNNIVPIDLTNFTLEAPINALSPTFLIAINPSGTKAYATTLSPTVPVINLTNNTFANAILGFTGSSGLAFIPSGTKAYVTDIVISNVFPILVKIDTPQPPILGFQNPVFVSIIPDQAPTASFTFTTAATGSATIFDASASSSPDGFIESYAWDFGDGTTEVTTSPIISHVYSSSGSFTVTLTVTNSQGTSTFQTFTGKTVSNNGGPSAQLSQLLYIIPSPPTNFSGKLIKEEFATHTDYIIRLTWTPSTDPNVIGYKLFRNGVLIATIPGSGPFKYEECKKHKKDTYTLIAFDAQGFESIPVTTTVSKKTRQQLSHAVRSQPISLLFQPTCVM